MAMLDRLMKYLPKGWFPNPSENVSGVMAGGAYGLQFIKDLTDYADKQTRIKTSTDGWLDIVAADFFGENQFPRQPGETDPHYLTRIRINMFREAGTLNAIKSILKELTGNDPTIYELFYGDNGDTLNYAEAYPVGYPTAAAPTPHTSVPYQAFVIAYLGIPNTASGFFGYDTYGFAYDVGFAYAPPARSLIDEQLIYQAVAAVKLFGTIVWVQIKDTTAP
jgi:hypothetical protein